MSLRSTARKWVQQLDRVLSASEQSQRQRDADPLGIRPGTPTRNPGKGESNLALPDPIGLQPVEGGPKVVQVTNKDGSTSVYSVPGTLITGGFMVPMGEFNPLLMGRDAVAVWEKMRRTSSQVDKTLEMCIAPIVGARWDIIPDDGADGKQSQKEEIAKAAKENFFGGLEYSINGTRHTQTWNEALRNILLMLAMGCSAYEEVYAVEGGQVRLAALADLPPKTFYQWDVEPDGRTLRALIQLGYRGAEFKRLEVPAERLNVFTYRQEGADFWGRSILRAAYSHWYAVSALYAIRNIGAERTSIGVPCITLPPNASADDKNKAVAYVTQLAAHQKTGLVIPNGAKFEIVGVSGRTFDSMQDITHHNEQISFVALDFFSNLGRGGSTGASGNRALMQGQGKFFMLALQNTADFIAQRMTSVTLRRWTAYNYGPDAPVPVMKAANVQSRGFEEVMALLTQAAANGLMKSDKGIRDYIRTESGTPQETDEDVIAIRGETISEGVEGPAGDISGRSAGAIQDLQAARAKMPDGAPGKKHVESAMAKLQPGAANPADADSQNGKLQASESGSSPQVYFLRHGHTRFNKDSDPMNARIRSVRDVPLDEEGRRQASELGEDFKGVPLKAVYTSPMRRARAVADAIAGATGAKVIAVPELGPWDEGELAGRKVRDVLPQRKRLMANPSEPAPGGQSYGRFARLAGQGIDQVLDSAEAAGGPVAAVTHSSVISLVKPRLAGEDVTKHATASPATGSILKLTKRGAHWKAEDVETPEEAAKTLSEARARKAARPADKAARATISPFWKDGHDPALKLVHAREAHVNFPAHQVALDLAEQKIKQVLLRGRRKLLRQLASNAAASVASGKAAVAHAAPEDLQSGIAEVLSGLYQQSRKEMRAESDRLNRSKMLMAERRSTGGDVREQDPTPLIAEIAANRYTGELANGVQRAANNLRTGSVTIADLPRNPDGSYNLSGLSKNELADLIWEEASGTGAQAGIPAISPNLEANIAAIAARDTFRRGRSQEAQDILEALERAGVKAQIIRVGILDKNICGPCEAADGKPWPLDVPVSSICQPGAMESSTTGFWEPRTQLCSLPRVIAASRTKAQARKRRRASSGRSTKKLASTGRARRRAKSRALCGRFHPPSRRASGSRSRLREHGYAAAGSSRLLSTT